MPEEPCQCIDCQRFYREHDRLIREFPTLRQQQELSWAALQAFRTLSGRVLEDIQKQYGGANKESLKQPLPVNGSDADPVDPAGVRAFHPHHQKNGYNADFFGLSLDEAEPFV